jgi:hypothetical protein
VARSRSSGTQPDAPILANAEPVLEAYERKKVDFVAWLIGPRDEIRTQKQWARLNDLEESTLSRWKASDDVRGLIRRWHDFYEPIWARGLQNMSETMVDPDDPLKVQAFRTVSELMGKFKAKEVNVNVTLSTILGQLGSGEE